MPVLVCIKISPLRKRILHHALWALLITPKTVFEYPITSGFPGELGPQPSIVFENVGVPTRAIALIVEGGGLFDGRRRWFDWSVTIIVLLELDAVVAHHSALVHGIQGSIIVDDLDVSASAIAEIVDMLWVECSLQCGKILIGLCLVWMVHDIRFLLYW